MTMKNKETLAILSTKNIACGIASYASQLRDELSKQETFKAIDIIEVDQTSLRGSNYLKTTNELCDLISNYDCVNIQHEFSIFGGIKNDRHLMVLEEILKASRGKRVLLTLHTYIKQEAQNKESFNFTQFILGFPGLLYERAKCLCFPKKNTNAISACHQMMMLIEKYNNSETSYDISILVHKKSDAEYISSKYQLKVYDYPLIFATTDDILRYNNKNTKSHILEKYNLPKDKTYVGVFGFYGDYKGFDVALRAMIYLPQDYHIIMSTQLHPQRRITSGCYAPHSDIKKINALLEKNHSKIHFINRLNEDDFKELIAGVDICLLPYYDIGQTASGPLSYSIYLNNAGKIIISSTMNFLEYEQFYYKNCFSIIDQGNHVELAYKIAHMTSKKDAISKACSQYSPQNNATFYINLLKNVTRV